MMTQPERQNVLLEAVQPFKQAADKLTHPVWEVLADLSQLETYADSLTLELPLVDFFPLEVLPVSSTVQLSNSVDSVDKLANSQLKNIGYGDRTSSSFQPPMHSLGSRDCTSHPIPPPTSPLENRDRNLFPNPALSESRVSVNQPPVFSFRRRENANTNRHQSASSGEQEQSLSSHLIKFSAELRSVVQNQERPTPDNKLDRSFEGSGSEITTNGGEIQSHQAGKIFQSVITQLDSLASDILLTVDSVMPDQLANSSSLGTQQPIQSMVLDRNGLTSHTLGAISSLAEQLLAPQATASDGGSRLAPGKTPIMKTGITVRKDDGVESQALSHGTFTSSETVPSDQDLIATQSLHHSVIALSSQTEGTVLPSGLTDLQLAEPEASGIVEPKSELKGIVESGLHAPIDASMLAMLINDVLVEQARRHGVDLS